MTAARAARWGALAVALLTAFTRAQADWINLTGAENAPNIAEIYVEDDRVRVAFEIFVGDLDDFTPLTVDGFDALQFSDGSGERLELVEIPVSEPRLRKDRYSPFRDLGTEIPWATTMQPPEDQRVHYVELEYRFERQPDALTLVPPLGPNGLASENIGMIVFHNSVPVIDFRFLGGRETLLLDWNDPWYSRFENRNLSRHHQDALTSYLYVEPYEVRHEILIRPRDLDFWLDLGLSDGTWIRKEEFRATLDRVAQFLLQRNSVLIDGRPARAILDQASFVTIGMTGIQNFTPVQDMKLNTAVVGIMLSYPTPGIPQRVEMRWDLFNDRVRQVPATAVDPAGPFLTYLSPDDDTLVWQNFLQHYRLPEVEFVTAADDGQRRNTALVLLVATALGMLIWLWARRSRWAMTVTAAACVAGVLAAAAASGWVSRQRPLQPLPPDRAAFVLHALLRNVYHAFYLRTDADVYDKLALTVAGQLLEQVFLQQRRSFAVQSAGGAQARVHDVELLESKHRPDLDTPDALAYEARWTATGAVSHWGHTHERTNLYHALVRISPADDLWKVTDLRILSEERLMQRLDGSLPLPDSQPYDPKQ